MLLPRTGGTIVLHRLSIRFLVPLSMVAGMVSSAESPRLKDDDVKKLMEEAKNDVERFEDAVDSQFKKATIRSATAEVSIANYLKDLKKSAELMRDRFKEDNSAGTEVASFLRQANAIEKRSTAGGGLFGAEKEWPRLRGTLARLARVYGVDWSTSPESWTVRRMNDQELKRAIETYVASSKSFKKSLESALEHVEAIGKDERKTVLSAVDRLEKSANDLKDAALDGKDPSSALELMTRSTDEIRSFLDKHGLTSSVGSTFRALGKDFSTIIGALN
jgi:ferritin-like metal-binding protein YciE